MAAETRGPEMHPAQVLLHVRYLFGREVAAYPEPYSIFLGERTSKRPPVCAVAGPPLCNLESCLAVSAGVGPLRSCIFSLPLLCRPRATRIPNPYSFG